MEPGSPLRVGLEPEYDFGWFGVWVLDLPGCFVWRDDRSAALAAVPARVKQFGAWLASHGEQWPMPGPTSGSRRRWLLCCYPIAVRN
jgi:hypothetical protein